MTALDHPTYADAAPSRTQVVLRVTTGLKSVLRAMFNRRHVGNLAEMSDHHLADIGLTRMDIHQAARTGIVTDPTAMLASLRNQRAAERRTNRVA